jgi:hypothetical protein
MALQSNQQGFLVGERIVDGIDLVHKDISQILELMTQGYQRSKRNAFIARNVPNQVAANDIGQVSNTNAQGMQKLPKQLAQLKQNQAISSAIATNDIGASVVRAKILRQAQEPAILERDAKGRFVSGKQETDETKDAKIKGEDEQDKKDSVLKKILTTLAGKIHAPDSEHIDPTIDTLKEIGAFKAIGLVAGAGSWLLSLRGKKDDKKEGKDEDKKNSFSFLGSIFGGIISKAVLAAIAAVAIKKTGTAVNDAIQGTDIGRAATDAVGRGVDHVGAFFGNKDAQDRLSTNKDVTDKQVMIYNSFKKAGATDDVARHMTATVGREHDYGKGMYKGSMLDPSGKAMNAGIFNWEGDRAIKLKAVMSKKGLVLPNGDFQESQESIDAQTQFAVNEPQGKAVAAAYAANPNMSDDEKTRILAKKDIGWAYGQSVLANGKRFDWKKHLNKENHYLGTLDEALGLKKATSNPQAMPQAATSTTIPTAKVNPTDNSTSQDTATATPMFMKIAPANKQTGLSAPQVPPSPAVGAVPAMPTTQKQLNTPMPAPQTIPASNDSISQNLSDRDLAHAVTGGLGMSRWMG